MEKKYYIAYGSNLSEEQMKYRTPDAKIVGTAVLYGWQLLFKVHATIEPNEKKNTPVLVWEISEKDERNLDRYEGYPSYYYKKNLQVETFPLDGGDPLFLTAMVYIMADGRRLAEPFSSYYKVLEDGYKAFHFPIHILEQALADSIGREEAIKRLGKCSLTRKPGEKEKVKVICYDKTEEWGSRKEAEDFYRRCIAGSEGAERERYVNIYAKLRNGWDVCSDSDGIDPREIAELMKEVQNGICN